ncbi:HAD-IB family hydrolase, partial [Streptomyces minutiscleroticus]
MAALLGWLTPRRRSATARSVLAGEASAEAARKSSQELEDLALDTAPAGAVPEPEFPVVGDDKAAAFFDLDNTVMQGAALFHFGRGLYKRKFFETRDLARFAW